MPTAEEEDYRRKRRDNIHGMRTVVHLVFNKYLLTSIIGSLSDVYICT